MAEQELVGVVTERNLNALWLGYLDYAFVKDHTPILDPSKPRPWDYGCVKVVGDPPTLHNILSQHIEFVPREQAEHDPERQQIIPYIAIVDPEAHAILVAQRMGGDEKRLEGKITTGFGGHINPVDFLSSSRSEIVEQAARRELVEETGIVVNFGDLLPVGAIYGGDRAVEQVHLGVAFILPWSSSVHVTDPGMQGHMRPFSEVAEESENDAEGERYERWTQAFLQWLCTWDGWSDRG